jgi:hypothetical protein
MSDKPCKATPPDELLEQLLDCRVPKTEREHIAASKIEQLQAERAKAQPVLDAAFNQAQYFSENGDSTVFQVLCGKTNTAVREYKEE